MTPSLGRRGDFELRRQARPVDDQRMVSCRREILRDPLEHALAGMMHLGELAMHQDRRPHDPAAIDLPDGLMAETDAQDRHLWSGTLDQIETDAGPVRIARARGQHDRRRLLRHDLIDADLVVPVDARGRAQFPEEMHEVIGKAVVIIDERQHQGVLRPRTVGPSSSALPETPSFQPPARIFGVRNSLSSPLFTVTWSQD